MEKDKAFLLWFDQLERKDVAIAGGKSSSLGELTSHVMFPCPTVLQPPPVLTDISLKTPACMMKSKN